MHGNKEALMTTETPDSRAVRLFIEGKIRPSVWRHSVLPLCNAYVKSWCTDGEEPARHALDGALVAELIQYQCHNAEIKVPPLPLIDPNWTISKDGQHGIYRRGAYDCHFNYWKGSDEKVIAHLKQQFGPDWKGLTRGYWVSIFRGHTRIFHAVFESTGAAKAFITTFVDGVALDGQCFNAAHAALSAKRQQ
jgi:hypothetical protein